MSWSIVTVPAIGRRRPPMSTSPPSPPTADGARRRRSRSAPWRSTLSPLAAVAQAVGQTLAGGHASSRATPRLQRQRGPEVGRTDERGRRRDAVDGDAAPHEVVAGRSGGPSAAAELAAWQQRRPRGRRRSSSPTTSSNRASCSVGERVVGLVGHREVGPAPTPARGPAASTIGLRQRDASAGAAPTRCMPVSTLRCTGERSRGGARRAAAHRAVDAGRGVDGGLEVDWRRRCADSSAAASESTSIGASMPASRSSAPSSTSATPSASAPAASAARLTSHRAVAVAVGLHDRAEHGRCAHDARSVADVVGDRRQVDLGPGGALGYRSARIARRLDRPSGGCRRGRRSRPGCRRARRPAGARRRGRA